MSTKTKSTYQDPRYLQMWIVFDWPTPAERVPVACVGCGWTGRRARRSATARPCPSCTGRVSSRIRQGRPRATDSTRGRSVTPRYAEPVGSLISARYARPALVPAEHTAASSA